MIALSSFQKFHESGCILNYDLFELKEAVLIALLQRAETQKGSYVTVSLFDAAVSSLVNQATNYLNAQHIPQRMGNEHPNICPYGNIFQTKDEKQIVLAVGTDKQFTLLCQILKLEAVIKDERFQNNANRVKNREVLIQLLTEAFQKVDLQEALEKLQAAKVPAGSVNNMEQVFQTAEAQNILVTKNNWRGVRQFVAEVEGLEKIDLSEPPSLSGK